MIILKTNRSYYSDEEAERNTMTVGELIDLLEYYKKDEKIAFSNDDGYTYGYIDEDAVEEHYVRHLKNFRASDIDYEIDEDEDIAPPTTVIVACYDEDEVVEAVSDTTGWLVNSVGKIEEV